MKDLTKFIFEKISDLAEKVNCDFAFTKEYYSISRISGIYTLRHFLELLDVQKDYEIFVESERHGDEILYYIAGGKINE